LIVGDLEPLHLGIAVPICDVPRPGARGPQPVMSVPHLSGSGALDRGEARGARSVVVAIVAAFGAQQQHPNVFRQSRRHFCHCLKYLKSGGGWSLRAGIRKPSPLMK